MLNDFPHVQRNGVAAVPSCLQFIDGDNRTSSPGQPARQFGWAAPPCASVRKCLVVDERATVGLARTPRSRGPSHLQLAERILMASYTSKLPTSVSPAPGSA